MTRRDPPPRPSPRALAPRLLALLLVAAAALSLLAGCGLQSGGNTLAYLRDGQLWTVHPDGSNPLEIARGGVVSFAWSPDHHTLVFRVTNPLPAATPNPLSASAAPPAPGEIGAASINGGSALQLTPSVSGLYRGDAWWNPDGNRILYAEQVSANAPTPTYFVSQVDQAVGIARHGLLNAASLPVLAPDGKQVAVVAPDGALRIGAPGQPGTNIASGALVTLPVTNRPARVLWQPGHDALLYAAGRTGNVSLVLRTLSGATRTVASASALLDYAFAPSGTLLLIRTTEAFQLWRLDQSTAPVFSWPETDPAALPWWSPDSHSLLVQDAAGIRLVDVQTHGIQPLLAYSGQPSPPAAVPTAGWHPAAGTLWSPDGHSIVFTARAGDTWRGTSLTSPRSGPVGLYVATILTGVTQPPALIASGTMYAPSWSFIDPSTAFLVGS